MSLPRQLGVLRLQRADLALILATLVGCVLLKLHYRFASPEQLRWLLGPTALLSELTTGYEFRFETGAGYVSRELGLVIAPVCAGANYFVIALAALVAGFVWRFHSGRSKLLWFAASPLVAYLATLITNSLRIGLAVLCRPFGHSLDVAQRAQLHRVQGVLVYLVSLLVLYALTENRLRAGREVGALSWLPLVLYLGVTLLVPLALGARARPEFALHAAVVLAVVAGAVALRYAVRYTARA